MHRFIFAALVNNLCLSPSVTNTSPYHGILILQDFHLSSKLDLSCFFCKIFIWPRSNVISHSILLFYKNSFFCTLFGDFSPNCLSDCILAAFNRLSVLVIFFGLTSFIVSSTCFFCFFVCFFLVQSPVITISFFSTVSRSRGGSRTAATFTMEGFVEAVNYYHKVLHLGCCSSPRSTSEINIQCKTIICINSPQVLFLLLLSSSLLQGLFSPLSFLLSTPIFASEFSSMNQSLDCF